VIQKALRQLNKPLVTTPFGVGADELHLGPENWITPPVTGRGLGFEHGAQLAVCVFVVTRSIDDVGSSAPIGLAAAVPTSYSSRRSRARTAVPLFGHPIRHALDQAAVDLQDLGHLTGGPLAIDHALHQVAHGVSPPMSGRSVTPRRAGR